MQKIIIKYNPYKMETFLQVEGVNVCDVDDYLAIKEFIETKTPLQTWLEPIEYKDWKGLLNELTSDSYDELEIHFYGRKIDFEDLQYSFESLNKQRRVPHKISYIPDKELSDKRQKEGIDRVMKMLLSDEFKNIVQDYNKGSLLVKSYQALPEAYKKAQNKDFKVVFAGVYSSGKSTILNALIRHNILPTSDATCTSKVCRIKHDSKIGNKISLECFDSKGKSVVKKRVFDSDEACLKCINSITPINSKDSNPPSVQTIEIGVDLSHLYPSDAMSDFNLVIIDTPGSDSMASAGNTNTSDKCNMHEDITVDAITGQDKEMVVICVDALKEIPTSLGALLKRIYDEAQDDHGDFNDRFLFVLNKCDMATYNKGETITEKKKTFAETVTDTEKWGIRNAEDVNFVPRVFMLSAYVDLAIRQKAFAFSPEDCKSDPDKKNLKQAYSKFKENITEYEDPNYFLMDNCDIPQDRRMKFKEMSDNFLKEGNEAEVVRIQTGICCLESAIRDYIERYAYPFKVRALVDTFDSILKDITDWTEYKAGVLQKAVESLGEYQAQRKGAQQDAIENEKRKEGLERLKGEAEQQKRNIENINIDSSKLRGITNSFFSKIQSTECIKRSRSESGKQYSKEEIDQIVNDSYYTIASAIPELDRELSMFTSEYRNKVAVICNNLKSIARQIVNQTYNFSDYNYRNAKGIRDILNLNEDSLRDMAYQTRDYVQDMHYVKNPVKEEKYKWWQLISRFNQWLADDEILEPYGKEVYTLNEVQKYISNLQVDFTSYCSEMEQSYNEDINRIKKQARKMAGDIVLDIEMAEQRNEELKQKINNLIVNEGNSQEEIEKVKQQISLLCNLNEMLSSEV